MTGRILVADDDDILREFIALGLREAGFLVEEAATLADTMERAREGAFNLWVLDRHMPGGDFADALRSLRSEGRSTPALFLTAARTVERRVEGFEAGADDYLTKPFSIVELLARVRALLRRPQTLRGNTLERGRITLDLDVRRILVDGVELAATAQEWRLLALLAQRRAVLSESFEEIGCLAAGECGASFFHAEPAVRGRGPVWGCGCAADGSGRQRVSTAMR